MNDFITSSVFFGSFTSLLFYEIGVFCKKKWKISVLNPLLIAVCLTLIMLVVLGIDYDTYYSGAKYISYLLTPATVCLAIPLYEQFEMLKKDYVTFLPKSITTAIGMGVSEQLGGNVSVTVAVIIITGVFGNIIAEPVCRLFHITEPVAKGVGIGSASHAIGTTKAMEMGDIEGAMSGLSIAVSGMLTVVAAIIFSYIY